MIFRNNRPPLKLNHLMLIFQLRVELLQIRAWFSINDLIGGVDLKNYPGCRQIAAS